MRSRGSASNVAVACANEVAFAKRSGGSVTEVCHTCCPTDRRDNGGDRRPLRHGLRDVDLQELDPAVEDRGIERVGVGAVGHREPHLVGAGEVVEHVGEVRAGLLVLPRAGKEDRHVDAVHEQLGRERHRERRLVRVVLDHLQHVRRLAAQRLVRRADLVAVADPVARPALAARGRGLRVVLAFARPIEARSRR